MLRRAILLAAASAAFVPFLAGPASASCTDDLRATNFLATDTPWNPSSHYNSLSYVQKSGTATVTVWGDDAISDGTALALYYPTASQDYAANVAGATTRFVDCVAG
jgi:hypothetical protein